MQFTSLLLAASSTVASITQAQARDLQSLAQKLNITDPTFAYEGLHVDLDCQVTDFINDNVVAFAPIYDRGCQEGGNSVSNTILPPSRKGDSYQLLRLWWWYRRTYACS